MTSKKETSGGEQGRATPADCLRRAREGDGAALGRLLEVYRNYLRLIASAQLGGVLRLRLDPSDVVQETFLEAHRDFASFRGATERELMTWLRRILVRNLVDQARAEGRQRRDIHREESLETLLEERSGTAHEALAAGLASPSEQAARGEQVALLADALAALPERYQEVMILRHLERLPFEEIAVRMALGAGAVRMLWVRAMERLREVLGRDP